MSKEVAVIRGKMRQVFQEDEKKRIVAQSYQSELSLNRFAKTMGIAPPTLCLWRKQYKKDCTKDLQEKDTILAKNTQENDNFFPTNSQEITNLPMVSDRLLELENENNALKVELFTMKKAFGNKLIQLEMERMSHG